MDTVKVESLIVCTKMRRGNGKETPIRIVLEVFDFDGNFIAEHDSTSIVLEDIIEISKHLDAKNREILLSKIKTYHGGTL